MYRTVVLSVLAAVMIFSIVILGCSDKTFTTTETVVSDDASPTTYIPLEDGWRISYSIVEPGSDFIDIEVRDATSVYGHAGYRITRSDRTTGAQETFYRYQDGDAVFETGSTSEKGVRILDGPFVTGHSWNRIDQTVATDGDGDGGGGGKLGAPGLELGSTPDDDYNTMSIVGYEDVHALNGVVYGNCLKVKWQSSPSSTNYFWYAAGIGLVKFEYNYDYFRAHSNHTIGVMSNYQKVVY